MRRAVALGDIGKFEYIDTADCFRMPRVNRNGCIFDYIDAELDGGWKANAKAGVFQHHLKFEKSGSIGYPAFEECVRNIRPEFSLRSLRSVWRLSSWVGRVSIGPFTRIFLKPCLRSFSAIRRAVRRSCSVPLGLGALACLTMCGLMKKRVYKSVLYPLSPVAQFTPAETAGFFSGAGEAAERAARTVHSGVLYARMGTVC